VGGDLTVTAPLLVVGCGSIGERHLRNLRALGAGPLVACDSDPGRLAAVARSLDVETAASLQAGLARQPRAVLVCTPPSSHLAVALAAAEAGRHLFVEKPLAPSTAGVTELEKAVAARGLVALVACNMRFHPGVAQLKRWIDDGGIGRVLSVRAAFGHYLPNWRPGRDYREVYSARRAAGGGILADAIHELDYLLWFLGPMTEVAGLAGTLGDLEIDVEDTVELALRAAAGPIASVHLDCTQRSKRRGCEVVGTLGTLIWESRGKSPEQARVERYTTATDCWERVELPVDPNAMFVAEMAHFLRCLDGDEQPLADLAAGAAAVAVVEGAGRALRERTTVAL
jgi:predicted dehydrogenase